MNLNDDYITVRTEPDGIVIEPEVCGFLRQNGYNIDATSEVRVVPSESQDHAYLVLKIETTELPQGHPRLDIVEHQTEVIVCSCPDFRYHKLPDVSDGQTLERVPLCKHATEAFREQRAKEDPNQLAFNGGE